MLHSVSTILRKADPVMRTTRERTYRDCSVAGATPIGLLIALFDRLAGDLRRAASAIREGNIEARCSEINHALVIVGQLESWVDLQNGGASANQLSVFYAQLRSAMLEASMQQSAVLLERSVDSILNIRSRWQELDALAFDFDAFISSASVSHPDGASFSLSA